MHKLLIRNAENNLSLKNEGYLSIFFLGCGTAFSKKLFQNNIIIVKGNTSIFVDFGSRAPFALNLLGHNVSSISNLILTHSHADHLGGVEEAFLANRYFFKRKFNLIVPKPLLKILWEQSLKGGCSYSEYQNGRFLSVTDFIDYIRPSRFYLNYQENRKFYNINIDGIDIIFFQTKHLPSNQQLLENHQLTFGLIIDKKILYTSDTKFDKDFIEFLVNKYDIDYIFHDCQFAKGGVHASIDEITNFDEKLKHKIFLMHYPDDFEKIDVYKYGFAGFVKQWHFYDFILN